MKLSLIAAIGKNSIIGKDNDLIWHLPADLKYFKETTIGHHVLMGRKNYDSIPLKYRPLSDRVNLVISRDENYQADGAMVFSSIEEGIEFARKQGEQELFIIGGGMIYEQTIAQADQLYVTHIDQEFDGDVYFPPIDPDIWQLSNKNDRIADEKNPYNLSFCTYIRKENLIN